MSPPVAYATPVRPAGNWDGGKDRDRLIVAASTVMAEHPEFAGVFELRALVA